MLEASGARDWPHPRIAHWLQETTELTGWWAQGIAIGYEQSIGRRVPGQRADGTFEVSVTRRVAFDQGSALDALIEAATAGLDRVPSTSNRAARTITARWNLDGGERVIAAVSGPVDGVVVLTLTHGGMPTSNDIPAARARLKAVLSNLSLES